MGNILEVKNLTSGYGKLNILRNVSFTMKENIGIFGPNGHGKTTLLWTISGLLKISEGEIYLFDEPITNLTPEEIVNQGLIHVPQGNKLFPELTVGENLWLGSFAKKSRANEKENLEKVYEIFPRLKDRTKQLSKTLSGGERQMLSLGVGLMGNPKLILLDEPTLGLAPKLKQEVCASIKQIIKDNVPIILVEQDIDFLLSITNNLLMLNDGNIKIYENTEENLENKKIMEMYFGKTNQ